jgi:hypothetical protein
VLTKGTATILPPNAQFVGWYLSRLAIGYAQAGDVTGINIHRDAFTLPRTNDALSEFYRLRADFCS